MFDPYHKWLGIPKDQRPPTLYQLLGISPEEADADVIDEAAIRQTAHIRTYQIGPHARECTQVLNEISQARTTLLNPAKRKEYDVQLARKAAEKQRAAQAAQVAAAPSPMASVFANLDDEDSSHATKRAGDKKRAGRSPSIEKERILLTKPMLYGIIGGGVGFVLVIVLVLVLVLGGSKRPADNPVVLSKEEVQAKNDPNPAVTPNPDPNPEIKENKNAIPPLVKEPAPVITKEPDSVIANERPPPMADLPPGEGKIRHFGGDAPGASASLSPNGQLLVIAGPNRDLVVLDVDTGKERKLASRDLDIHQAIFVKDGKQVLAGAMEPKGALILYNVKGGGEKRLSLADPTVGFTFLAVAPDGRRILAGTTDMTLRVWNLETDQEEHRIPVKGVAANGAFFANGSRVFGAGTTASTRQTWLVKGELATKVAETAVFPNHVLLPALARNGDTIVLAMSDNKLSGKGHTLVGHQAPIQWIGFSDDDNLVVSADEKGQVSIWDLNQGKEIWRRFFPPAKGRRVEFVAKNRSLLITGNGVDLVDWVMGPPKASPNDLAKLPQSDPAKGKFNVHHYGGDAPGATADLSPSGELLVIAGLGRDLVLVDVKTGMERTLPSRAGGAHHPIFVKDGTHVLVAVREPSERLFLLNFKGEVVWQVWLEGREDVRWIFLSHAANRRQVLGGGTDNVIRTLDVEAIKGAGYFTGRYSTSDLPSSGGFSSDGRFLFGAGTSATKAWIDSFETGTNNRTHHAFPNCVAATMSKSFEYVMYANKEHSLLVAKPGGKPRIFGKHQATVQSLGFSSDDNVAVSADETGRISIWDLKQDKEICREFLPPAKDRKVEFLSGNRSLLITGNGVDIVDWAARSEKTTPDPSAGRKELAAAKLPPAPPEIASRLLRPSKLAISLGRDPRLAGLFSAPGTNLAALLCNEDGNKDRVEVVNTSTREKLAGFLVPVFRQTRVNKDLSPDGKYFGMGDLNGALTVWSTADGRPIIEGWPLPIARVKKTFAGQVGAFYFLGRDRLATVEMNGDVRAWQMPAMKQLWHVPHKYQGFQSNPIYQDGAVAGPDRARLAVFNGKGFSIIDTRLGQVDRATAPVPGDKVQVHGAAFTPDGRILVARLSQFAGGKRPENIVAFDVSSGRIKKQLARPEWIQESPLFQSVACWFGPDLVMLNNFLAKRICVLQLETGMPLAIMESDRQAAQALDGLHWYTAIEPAGGETWLAAIDIRPLLARAQPAEAPQQWVLTPWGLTGDKDQPTAPIAEAKSPGFFARRFIDPKGDCKLESADENQGSLKLSVPGSLHDLFPGNDTSGPRVLLDVDGDFLGEVRLSGNLVPAANTTLPGKVNYRAGGLLLWQDESNFVRLDRAAMQGRPLVNFSVFQNGKEIVLMHLPAADTLRLERKGNTIQASTGEGNQIKYAPAQPLAWPASLKFGVGVINSSSGPLQVSFEGLKLIPANGKKR